MHDILIVTALLVLLAPCILADCRSSKQETDQRETYADPHLPLS